MKLGYSGKCDMLSTIRTDQIHQPWRTFVVVINRCIYGKSARLDRLRELPDNRETSSTRKEHMPYSRFTKVIIDHFISKDNSISMRNMINLHISCDDTLLGKRVKRAAKKATTALTTDVVIKDTSDKSVSKKKAPVKTGSGKGIELLSDATLLEEAQMKKALNKSKRQTHNFQDSGSSEGANFELEVPDEPTRKTKDTSEGTDESDDDHDEDDNDDDDGNDDDSDYEEEEQDEKYVFSPKKDKYDDEEKMFEEEDDDVTKELYGDLNNTQGLRDTDLTNAQQGPMQSSSISSDFTSKLLNLDDPSSNINSLMNTSTIPPPPPPVYPSSHPTTIPQQQTPDSTTTTTYPTTTLPEIPNFASLFQFNQRQIIKEQVKAQVSKIMPQIEKYVTESLGAEVLVRSTNQPQTSYVVAASLSKFELKKILIEKMETNKSINRSDIQKNLYNALVEAYNYEKDIFTSYGNVFTLKRGRDDQDKNEDTFAGSDRGTKIRKSSKDAEPSKGSKLKESKSYSSSKGTQSQYKSSEGREYSFDLSKPIPLIEVQGRQVVPADYFIKNYLKYLKGRSLSSKYTNSTTRTKAAKYDNMLSRNISLRSRIMVKAIDKLLFEMRLMRNLEKFVGGHDYGNDLRLLKRTI
nr:hypothetical protein [Tanacetum cinerariifolium]